MKKCKDCKEKDISMAKKFGRPRFQADGSIIYPKKGHEPPPDLDGYQRDPGNYWRFTPLWQSCAWRLQNQFLKACGAVGILSICTHPEGPTENNREVQFSQCCSCPLEKYK